MSKENLGKFHYGGQAVIEGVMMRGRKHFAVACRKLNGEITTTAEPIEGGVMGKLKWLNRPFLRGTLALADSLVLGMKSLMWSANVAMEDEQARLDAGKSEEERKEKAGAKSKGVNDVVLNLTMFVSIAIAILIFMFLPIKLTRWVLDGVTTSTIWRGLLEGGIKLTFFFLYVWGISHWKDIRRVFEYHGAEHKVINAHEAGEELTVGNVQKYTTVHVRCGTSFLLIVILVSIIIFAAVPWQNAFQRLAYKLVLLPFVAGIAYEVIKLAGSRKESKPLRAVLGLGLLMQRITTQEPSDDQVEVAIRSFQSVRDAEEKDELVANN